jgi:DNA-binding PadR family transcriptional regulator
MCAAHIAARQTFTTSCQTMMTALRPVEFHILLALAGEEQHGYAILQEVARLTAGELEIEPGTLYRALHRMLKDGWVAESARRPAADVDDERRRYYRITPLGRRVATAEADRLWRLVTVARAHRLLTRA